MLTFRSPYPSKLRLSHVAKRIPRRDVGDGDIRHARLEPGHEPFHPRLFAQGVAHHDKPFLEPGLSRIAHSGTVDADETQYLDPIFEQLELGMSPGQLVLERWEGEWAHSVDRLVDYARY